MKLRIFKSDYIIYAILAVMLLLMTARTALHMSIPPVAVLFAAVIPVFFVSESQLIALALSFLALGVGFQYKYALLIYLIVGIIRFRNKMSLNQMILPIVLMAFWELLHGFSGVITVVEFLRNFAELFFLVFVASIKWTTINYKVIARALALSVIGISLVIIYVHLKGGLGSFLYLFDGSVTEHTRFGQGTTQEGTAYGLNFNPNNLGYICNMAIAQLLLLIAMKENKLFDYVLLILCILIGLTTLSRTFIVVLVCEVLLYIFASSRKLRSKIVAFIKILIPVLILILILYKIFPFVFENFMNRNDTDDITNGRTFLMQFYHSHIFSSFKHCFWGVGLQNYEDKIADLYGPNILACHNGVQELWVTWGVWGLFLFTYLIICIIKISKKTLTKRSLLLFMPMFALLLASMAGQLISSGMMMLSLSLTFITLCINRESDKKELYV